MLRTIRNTVISAVILVILFTAAGVIYVLISGRSDPKRVEAAKAASIVEASPIPKPRQPSPNARESAAVETVTSPVAVGDNSSISIKTNAGSVCKIKLSHEEVVYKDSGLANMIADNFGNVTWTWTMAKTAPFGKWLIEVNCTYHGRSAMVQSNLIVTKP